MLGIFDPYNTLTGTTTQVQSLPHSDPIEDVLYPPKTSRTGVSQSDDIYSQTQDTLSIWPIHSSQTDATTPDQSQSGSNAKEEVLYIPKSSRIRVPWSYAF